jgi:IQ calmodulin-binding motif
MHLLNTNNAAFMTPHSAAVIIQTFWRSYKYKTNRRKILAGINRTQKNLKWLEKYRNNMSMVHPSKIHTWEEQRRVNASIAIQKCWRSRRKRIIIKRASIAGNILAGPVADTSRAVLAEVDIQDIEDLILSRIRPVNYVLDFAELDRLLEDHYLTEFQLRLPKGIVELSEVHEILQRWEDPAFHIVAPTMSAVPHCFEVEQTGRKWWQRIPEEGSKEEALWIDNVDKWSADCASHFTQA